MFCRHIQPPNKFTSSPAFPSSVRGVCGKYFFSSRRERRQSSAGDSALRLSAGMYPHQTPPGAPPNTVQPGLTLQVHVPLLTLKYAKPQKDSLTVVFLCVEKRASRAQPSDVPAANAGQCDRTSTNCGRQFSALVLFAIAVKTAVSVSGPFAKSATVCPSHFGPRSRARERKCIDGDEGAINVPRPDRARPVSWHPSSRITLCYYGARHAQAASTRCVLNARCITAPSLCHPDLCQS